MLIYTMTRIDGVITIKAVVDGHVFKKTVVQCKRGEEDCRKRNIC